MIFKEFGKSDMPTVILLHGGGLSWWSLKSVVSELKDRYHIITPVIDGYGEDSQVTFISIENSADKLINYIDKNYGGRIFALGGLSIGAQIAADVLSKRKDIAKYAVLESALVVPIKLTKALTIPMCALSYGLIKRRWFSELQAKELSLPQELFEDYYQDSMKISKESLINTILSNGTYKLKTDIANTTAKTLVIVGDKEVAAEKKSAEKIHKTIKSSRLYTAKNMKHGELSLKHPKEYAALLKELFES